MCFSAAASFTAASIAASAGVLTVTSVSRAREIPLASAPLVFAVQQSLEGALWLAVPHGQTSLLALCLANAFVVCAMVIWPVLAPVAVGLVEPVRLRRNLTFWLVPVGLAFAAYSALDIASHPYHAVISYRSLCYINNSPYPSYAIAIYLAATSGGFLLSSQGTLRAFGLVIIVSFIASIVLFVTALVSVWCFFAAVASAILVYHFRYGSAHARIFGAR